MENEYDLPSAKELCARVVRLQATVAELLNNINYLEAEVLALGNIMIKKNVLSLNEIEQLTSAIMHQKIAEKSSRSPNAADELRKEFEEALQEKIHQ